MPHARTVAAFAIAQVIQIPLLVFALALGLAWCNFWLPQRRVRPVLAGCFPTTPAGIGRYGLYCRLPTVWFMHISLTIQPGKFVLNAVSCASPAAAITSENGTFAGAKTEDPTLGSSLPCGLRDRSTARNDAVASLEQEGEAP